MEALRVEALSKRYGHEQVLEDVSFSLGESETLSILGRSGSGKTTLLKIVAGLEVSEGGRIFLGDEEITSRPPQDRGIVYLYQEPLLLPHLDLVGNLTLPIHMRARRNHTRIRFDIEPLLAELGLSEHRHKMPHQLSGGMRQRVAFGRALTASPRVLLLDEPFSSLDPEIRASAQRLFKEVAARHQIPALFVSHDLEEALLMGDRIAMMEMGRLRVFDSKQAFVADPSTGVGAKIRFWRSLEE